MTVSTSTNSVSYNGNGVTSVFAYTFPILSSDWLRVTRRNPNGTENTLVKDTDYFVLTGVGSPTGGNITITPTPPGDSVITIRRVVPATQLVDLTPNDPFPAETIEDSLDKLTMLASGAIEGSDRTLKLRETDVDGSGAYNAKGNRITSLGQPSTSTDAVNLSYMQEAIANAASFGVNRVPQEFEFVGDGTTFQFVCPGIEIENPLVYLVTVDGILQNPGSEYTIDIPNESVIFPLAPPLAGTEINVRVLGFQAQIPAGAGAGSASASTFYRGDGQFAKKLIATTTPLPAPPPNDAALGFGVDANTNRLVLQLNSLDRSAVRFGVNGGAETFEMGLEYTTSLGGAMQVVRGGLPASATFYKSGDISLGTSISSLYVDADVQRVGIGGMLAPAATLHVAGDAIIDGTLSAQLDGADIVTGVISPNRLATGIPDNTKFLRGDGTWASGTGGGSYTDANAVAAISAALVDTTTIDMTGGATISAAVIAGSIGATQLADGGVTTAKIADANVTIAKINATGTPSSTTFLRGDGSWQAVPGGSRVNDEWFLYDTVSARDELRITRSTTLSGVGITSEASLQILDPAGPTWRSFIVAGCASGELPTVSYLGKTVEFNATNISLLASTVSFVNRSVNIDALRTSSTGGFRVVGRQVGSGSVGVFEMSGTEATAGMDVFTSSLKGLAPASGGGTTNFLRADGTWAAPGASGITVGDTATIDLTLSSGNLTASVVGGSIGTSQIAVNGVLSANIANDAVTSTKIANGAVTVGKIATNAVGSLNIIDGQVVTSKIADSGVTASKLAASSVELAKINATGAAPSRVLRINGAGTGLEWSTAGGSIDTTSSFLWTGQHEWRINYTDEAGAAPGHTIRFTSASNSSAAIEATRIAAPTGDRQGWSRITYIRKGGSTGNAQFFYYTDRALNNQTAAEYYFDIADTVISQAHNISWGGSAYGTKDALWYCSFSPTSTHAVDPDNLGIVHTWGPNGSFVRIGELNYGNGWGHCTFLESRDGAGGRVVCGLEFFPDWLPGDVEKPGAAYRKYDVNWAICIGSTTPDAVGYGAKHHLGVLIDKDSLSSQGVAHMIWGGVNTGTRADSVMRVKGQFQRGIDLSAADFNNGSFEPAIELSADQAISVNKGGTDARIYWSSAGNELRIRIGGTDYRFNLTAV